MKIKVVGSPQEVKMKFEVFQVKCDEVLEDWPKYSKVVTLRHKASAMLR